jgi:hypothetical protein
MNRYPHSPGHRGIDTSVEAAAYLEAGLRALQRKAFVAIRAAGPRGLTTEELTAVLDAPYSSVQPRTSELQRLGLIRDSGLRRRNASGCRAKAWIVPGADEVQS